MKSFIELMEPGLYHGSRRHKRLPVFKHEFLVVVPKNPERLKKSTQRKLRVVNGKKVLVAGGYGETGGFMGLKGLPSNTMKSRLADVGDVDFLKRGKATLRKVSSKKSTETARRVAKSSKAFKGSKYPNLWDNMQGKGDNSNTYARSLLNKLGHKAPRKREIFTPGGDRRMKV